MKVPEKVLEAFDRGWHEQKVDGYRNRHALEAALEQLRETIVCEQHGIEEHECGSNGVTLGLYRNSQGLCANCGQAPAELPWGDPNRAHEGWCRRCALSAQLEHARERAAAIPGLEAELRVLAHTEGGEDG